MDVNVVLIIVIGVVVVGVLALVLGRGLTITRDGGKLEFKADEAKREIPTEDHISVADHVELTNVRAGNVTGTDEAHHGGTREVDVLRNAKVKGGSIGDISGVRHGGSGNADSPDSAA